MMKLLSLASILVLTVTPALAQQQAETLAVDEFLRQAIQDNIADVEIGRMARSDPATPPAVQNIGRALSDSAIRINEPLAKLANGHAVPVANQLEPQDRTAIRELSKTQGEDFVRKYLQYVIGDLEGDIRLYKRAADTDSAQIRQFAQDTLPVLEANLAMARQVWEQQVAEEPAPVIEGR